MLSTLLTQLLIHRTADHPQTPEPDPIGPYTPEAAEAIHSSQDIRQSSAALRKEIKDVITHCINEQKVMHLTVNGGVTQKIAETVNLMVSCSPSGMSLPPVA